MSEQKMMECGAAISTDKMEAFIRTFQQSAKRWEVIVYPALFAFILLAGYGFFLIYSLTSDIAIIARSMDPQMGQHMEIMSDNMNILSKQIQTIATLMDDMSEKLNTLNPMLTHMSDMESSIARMNQTMHVMTATTEQIQMDMMIMGQHIGDVARPMSRFNSMPWMRF
jgi:uncharacterized protein YoxC